MELYLVRHGQSEGNLAGRHSGWSTVPLSEKGMRQATQVGRYLSTIPFDRIISSDVFRARQTAELALPGKEYQLEPRIREIDSGSLVGQLTDDCEKRYGEAYIKARDQLDYRAYGGESDAMVAKRVESFLQSMEVLAEQEGKDYKIAVFSHEWAIRRMVCYALGVEYSKLKLRFGNCTVIKLEYAEGSWRLRFVVPLEFL